ncbi:MAG: hypothetical protein HXM43_12000 [Lautropia mirabilis]|nr:hypothetical protein [Lautropia mirabilis]
MRHSSMQRLPMTSTSGWGRASIPQQGIVMLMTLILLTVMAVSTAVAVRLSLTTDMVGANLRARTLAFQAAEAALRYCEEKVINEFSTLPMLVNYQKDEEWADDSAWAGPAKLEVPREQLGLPDNIKKNPQCLFRFLTIDEWRKSAPPEPGTVTAESRGFDADRFLFFRITVRGFSPGYQEYAARKGNQSLTDYQSAKGAEVRLQSMVRAIR